MAYINKRTNKNGKTTSWYYSVSNYPFGNIRKGKFKTRREAENAAKYVEEKLAEEKKNRKKIHSKYDLLPFNFEFEYWIKKKKSNLNQKTIDGYLNASNKVKHFFGDELLINVTHDMYQDFMDAQQNNTKSTNEKLNKKIRTFVKYAFEHNKIHANFTNGVSIYGAQSNKKKLFISTYEYEMLLNYLSTDNLPILDRMMILLAATTGIRYGELCAVRWKDIDFERQCIHIHQQWLYTKGSGFTDLKNPNIYQKDDTDIKERTIPLSNQTITLLKTFQKSDSYIENEHGRLFYKANCKAQVVSNNTFNNTLNKVLTSLNIESITAHGLRHSFATYQVHKKIDRSYLQYLMGHTDYRTTDKYYVHLHEEMFEKNANEMKEALDGLEY
ncbi:tyrosine-type recombinase/integrase [Lysinibacillus varians]|uniref:Site-specific integrase n=1 Tax=Lysinibacillus varians TaxID=1145276 RepID=A0ABY2T941_9BACI|nr:site-specific integrase [Lysinibacillus varians]AHN24413.1 hypothetical protein T479_16985 [Lysinibacillus varians]TKI51129.1 site-specific integrase [Lysinibacillus varians]